MTKAKIAATVWIALPISMFGRTEFVIGVNEYIQYGFKGFKFTKETTASATKTGYVMTKIGVYTFNIMRITFIPIVADVSARENHVKIAAETVRAIFLCVRNAIHHAL